MKFHEKESKKNFLNLTKIMVVMAFLMSPFVSAQDVIEITVTVENRQFVFNPDIETLESGNVYRFLQEDRSNNFHPLLFALNKDGHHSSENNEVSSTRVGTSGTSGSYVELEVTTDSPIFPFCENHRGMGGDKVFEIE